MFLSMSSSGYVAMFIFTQLQSEQCTVTLVQAVQHFLAEAVEGIVFLFVTQQFRRIICDNVSATKPDTITAPASVSANSVNSLPVLILLMLSLENL